MTEINNLQKTLIHIGLSDLGIPDEDYRMMLDQKFGVDTCKDLQYSQASAFIDDLKKKGFRIRKRWHSAKRKAHSDKIIYLPTKGQLSLIEHLRQDVIWRVHDGYWRWMEKFLGRTFIKTEKEAQKVIEALKNMKAYQNRRPATEDEGRRMKDEL